MDRVHAVMKLPYAAYADYLKSRYGAKTYRVSVDAGFTCPNRTGAEGTACAFCASGRARAPYLGAGDIPDQVAAAVGFLRQRYEARVFLLYFQASCGTNAPVGELKRIYDSALGLDAFHGLIVGTRPDCLDEEKAALLGSYARPDFDVWVEIGLQSAHDPTLRRIDRGHTAKDFLRAFTLCRRRGLKIGVHLIFGLPGESSPDILDTVRFVSRLDPDGVKIHNLHIPLSSGFARQYTKGELTAPGPLSHLEYVIHALELLPPRTLIMRLTTDTPADGLLSPRHFWDKRTFTSRLAAEMHRRGTRQGRLFSKPRVSASAPRL
jgi:radical SAM protein (TIGR01212 family)